jgi:hypothetical protein
MDSYLLTIMANQRGEDLREQAERQRRAIVTARGRRANIRLRGRNITVEIHLSADLRPEQIDQIFASLACHLDSHAA